MDKPEEFDTPWSEHTVVKASRLSEHLCSGIQLEEDKLNISSFIIKPNHGIIDYQSFIRYLGKKFMYFALSEDEIAEADRPMHRAQKLSDFKDDAKMDGKWGELILFTLVDGLMDIPMMSHKLAWKQNPTDQVKGSDGLFFGEFKGELSLGIGEAKMYKDLKRGVKKSLESTDRFHDGGSQIRNQHELTVASGNLSENLSSEKIEMLASLFTGDSRDYQILHPIFIGYNDPQLEEIQTKPVGDDEELISIIRNHISNTNLPDIVHSELGNFTHLRKHWLVFFFLPLEDKDRFSENMKSEIYPFSTNH